jgi:hypothetical protein
MAVDWFEQITGFPESAYESTRSRLSVEDGTLVSLVNGKRTGVGTLEVCHLNDLRARAVACAADGPRTTVRCLAGDVRALHGEREFAGALFQVASQFNLLEMESPQVSPEAGVTRYINDRTQGPACAMAAGAATIYRNYFAPVDGQSGQTSNRQIDALARLGSELAVRLSCSVRDLWEMRNGYALCTTKGLSAIGELLGDSSPATLEQLRGLLAIGLHRQVEVTDPTAAQRQRVSQAFCSALPVAYSRIAPSAWESFARLVLEAAYEATLLAGADQCLRGGSNIVLLTRLGGGAFGNNPVWIDDAIERALALVANCGLDVRLVGYKRTDPASQAIVRRWDDSATTAGSAD